MIGVNTVPRPGTIFTSEQCPGDRQFLGGGGGGGGGGTQMFTIRSTPEFTAGIHNREIDLAAFTRPSFYSATSRSRSRSSWFL